VYSATFDVANVAVECRTNEPAVLQVLRQTFSVTYSPASILVIIEVGTIDQDAVLFDPRMMEIQAQFAELGDIEGYGYHNATKWLLRAAAWVLEQKGIVCLHAAGTVWHGRGLMIVGKTSQGGKTTLSMHIAKYGGQFVGDEYLFYDGRCCHGCPRFKSHVRLGTLLAFPELRHLAPSDIPARSAELWGTAWACPVNVAESCVGVRIASTMIPRLILFSSLGPQTSTSIRKISQAEAIELLRAESVRHVAKLWMEPGTELEPYEVDGAIGRLQQLGIDISRRELLLSELVDRTSCFAIAGGSDLESLLQGIERLVVSLQG